MKIAKALAIVTLSVAAAFPALANTEWIVRPKESASGLMLLHATRQVSKPHPLAIFFDTPRTNKFFKYKFMRIGAPGKGGSRGFCYAGLNEKGLAVFYTLGDPNSDPNPKKAPENLGHGSTVPTLCGTCANAQQAVETLRQAFKNKRLEQYKAGKRMLGMIFMIADPNRAFIVECSPRHFASWELPHAFCAYSNCWKLPGMDDASYGDAQRVNSNYQREWSAAKLLRRAFDKKKVVSVADSIAISRTDANDMNAEEFNAIRGKNIKFFTAPHNNQSFDSYLFELDSEFPDVLSCVYTAYGPARHTVYLPIPIGAADALPKELMDPAWLNGGLERLKKAGKTDPVDQRILEFEKKQLNEFNRRRAKVRSLLRIDKREEGIKLLKDTLRKQAAETKAFLDGLK